MPVKWKRTWISDETFESAGVFDVDGDGVPDIVSGAYWYKGPDFRRKHQMGDVRAVEEYYDDFSTIPMDINGNGRLDFVTGGWWGNNLRWRENPENPVKPWPEHVLAADTGNVETTRGWDVDGDGAIEIVPNTPNSREVNYYKLITDATGKGTGAFRKITAHTFPEGQSQGHGLGCGDVAGNGRMDILLCSGWLEAPADPENGEWIWHADFPKPIWGRSSIPMLVTDLTGNGMGDLIVGNSHGYGLWWIEQGRAADGSRSWKPHPIDPFNAQYHDMMWVDIDGDGACELVAGKRHRAHCGNDKGEWDDLGLYYFKWTGEGFAKQVVNYGPIGQGKGCGIHFAVADLRGTGRMDIVAPGKDGLSVFFNEGD